MHKVMELPPLAALSDRIRALRGSLRTFTPAGDLPQERRERRRHSRKQVAATIHLIEIDESNAPARRLSAAVLNVSKRGMCVLTDQMAPVGRAVMLDVAGKSERAGRSVLARVTRLQRARGQDGFVLGLTIEPV